MLDLIIAANLFALFGYLQFRVDLGRITMKGTEVHLSFSSIVNPLAR